VKTLKHVSTEMALHFLGYNMKRVMRIPALADCDGSDPRMRQATWAILSVLSNHKTPRFHTAWDPFRTSTILKIYCALHLPIPSKSEQTRAIMTMLHLIWNKNNVCRFHSDI
jgi:hypothetical protein